MAEIERPEDYLSPGEMALLAEERHDEETMFRVHGELVIALARLTPSMTLCEQANQVVEALQNAGILFRERS